MTFEDFHKAITSDELWMEAMRNPSRGKDLKAAIEKVYGQAVSDGSLKIAPIGEHRKHVFNTLGKMPFSKVNTVQLQQTEVKKEDERPIESVPYEVHQKRLEDWLKSIAEIPAIKKVPRLTSEQIKEEGQWEPKREKAYHPDEMLVIRHRLKIEYARQFSNPLSHEGRLLPGSPPFEDWMEQQIANEKNEPIEGVTQQPTKTDTI